MDEQQLWSVSCCSIAVGSALWLRRGTVAVGVAPLFVGSRSPSCGPAPCVPLHKMPQYMSKDVVLFSLLSNEYQSSRDGFHLLLGTTRMDALLHCANTPLWWFALFGLPPPFLACSRWFAYVATSTVFIHLLSGLVFIPTPLLLTMVHSSLELCPPFLRWWFVDRTTSTPLLVVPCFCCTYST